jgi:DNA-binding NarL/FixJ family response regulator
MSALAALPRNAWSDEHLDAESLEQLVLVCLESLATLASEHGQRHRAARLLDAAGLLRDDPLAIRSTQLTVRELEVASLIARGYSNRQIATVLVISERTVDAHVSHILHKLSLVSRAQIAAWVVQQATTLRRTAP